MNNLIFGAALIAGKKFRFGKFVYKYDLSALI